jgi:hypothetical protein
MVDPSSRTGAGEAISRNHASLIRRTVNAEYGGKQTIAAGNVDNSAFWRIPDHREQGVCLNIEQSCP